MSQIQSQLDQSILCSHENTPIIDLTGTSQLNYSAVDDISRPFLRHSHSDDDRQQEMQDGSQTQSSWIRSLREQFTSLELENKGSVARDHLALERTFLAWLRTSLAFASIGVAITQLFRLNPINLPTKPFTPVEESPDGDGNRNNHLDNQLSRLGKPLGGAFIAIAILVLIVGFRRYFAGQYWIVRGRFPASRGSITLIAMTAGSLIVASLAVILAVSPGVLKA
ncbi:hypothetical protein KEM54_001894 [Ascosphaera aggregata]|nr:hypothetical protein KEM54_001894 [Ascosphaera aggregata]